MRVNNTEDNPTVILCTYYIDYHVRTPRQSKVHYESKYLVQFAFTIQYYSNKTIKRINTEVLLIFQRRFASRHR